MTGLIRVVFEPYVLGWYVMTRTDLTLIVLTLLFLDLEKNCGQHNTGKKKQGLET